LWVPVFGKLAHETPVVALLPKRKAFRKIWKAPKCGEGKGDFRNRRVNPSPGVAWPVPLQRMKGLVVDVNLLAGDCALRKGSAAYSCELGIGRASGLAGEAGLRLLRIA
jgi:hypothetical protein